ncbi:MAG: hypothetical protein ABI577_09085 [bacterium]
MQRLRRQSRKPAGRDDVRLLDADLHVLFGLSQDGLALGTVGLPEPKMRDLVLGAGFASFERVPNLEHRFNAYYIARP